MVTGGRPLAMALGAMLALALGAGGAACDAVDDPTPDPPVLVPEGGTDVDAARSSLCVDGKPAGDWPPGPYEIALTSTLPPDLAFEGPSGTVRLKDYYEPCAPRSRLLVVRSTAAWCGPCIWHATHTTKLIGDPRYADRLQLLDLLIADEDNMPATPEAATRWRGRIDAPAGVDAKFAIDASYMFSKVLAAKNVLPEYVLVDTRTMEVRTVLSAPDPQTFAGYLAVELAALDRQPRPDFPERKLFDGILTEDQWDLLHDMTVPGAPPADPTNEYADVPAAAALGKKFFEDAALSPSGMVSCATCHDATKAFGDALPQSKGVSTVDRNSPPVVLSAHARWQFWDGRADTLWMQALGPPENGKEIGGSRVFVVQQIAARYAAEYAAVFGAKYPFPDLNGVPANGKPGDAAYDALSAAKKDELTRVYVNFGKAIAAFERTLRLKPNANAFDRYVAGDTTALVGPLKQALEQFFKVGCVQCHWGPRLTDDAFHAVRFPTGRQDGAPDKGRADVLLGLASAEFIASSKWSDAPQAAKPLAFTVVPPSMIGAFKTPTLRGVSQSAPFGHGGTFKLLSDVTKHYGQRAEQVSPATAGIVEEWVPNFDANVQVNLPALLDVLTADPAP